MVAAFLGLSLPLACYVVHGYQERKSVFARGKGLSSVLAVFARFRVCVPVLQCFLFSAIHALWAREGSWFGFVGRLLFGLRLVRFCLAVAFRGGFRRVWHALHTLVGWRRRVVHGNYFGCCSRGRLSQ